MLIVILFTFNSRQVYSGHLLNIHVNLIMYVYTLNKCFIKQQRFKSHTRGQAKENRTCPGRGPKEPTTKPPKNHLTKHQRRTISLKRAKTNSPKLKSTECSNTAKVTHPSLTPTGVCIGKSSCLKI